jgi:hypothetical protein
VVEAFASNTTPAPVVPINVSGFPSIEDICIYARRWFQHIGWTRLYVAYRKLRVTSVCVCVCVCVCAMRCHEVPCGVMRVNGVPRVGMMIQCWGF